MKFTYPKTLNLIYPATYRNYSGQRNVLKEISVSKLHRAGKEKKKKKKLFFNKYTSEKHEKRKSHVKGKSTDGKRLKGHIDQLQYVDLIGS